MGTQTLTQALAHSPILLCIQLDREKKIRTGANKLMDKDKDSYCWGQTRLGEFN